MHYQISQRPVYQMEIWRRRFEYYERRPQQFLVDPLYIDTFIQQGRKHVISCRNKRDRQAMLTDLGLIIQVAGRTRQTRLAMHLAASRRKERLTA